MSKATAQKSVAASQSASGEKNNVAAEAPNTDAMDSFNAGAEEAKIIWARVKGYPWWPAQVLPDREASKRLAYAPKRKEQDTPVMFFGTLEVAWMSKRDISTWCDGLEQGYDAKYKNPRFTMALAQVKEFLMPNKKRKAPESWWCKVPSASFRKSKSCAAEPSPPPSVVSTPFRNSSEQEDQAFSKAAAPKPKAVGKPAPDCSVPAAGMAEEQVGAACVESAAPLSHCGEKERAHKAALDEANTLQAQDDTAAVNAVHSQKAKGRTDDAVEGDRFGKRKADKKTKAKRLSLAIVKPEELLPAADGIQSASVAAASNTADIHALQEQDVAYPAAGHEAKPALTSTDDQAVPMDTTGSQEPLETCAHDDAKLLGDAAATSQVQTAEDRSPPTSAIEDGMTEEKQEEEPSMLAGPAVQAPPRFSCWPMGEALLPVEEQEFQFPEQYFMNKSPTYKHITQNTYLSKLHKPKRQHKEKIHVCNCTVPGDLYVPGLRDGCGEGCLNRESNIHCDPRICPAGQRCSNRPFHQIPTPRTDVFLTENRGYGVRAAEFVKKGTFVVEYVGEVVDEPEMRQRMAEALDRKQPHYYIMELAQGLYIDARTKGNMARLLNSRCSPNCEAQRWQDAVTGEYRVGIFARKDIQPGEELTYDYHFQHHNKDDLNKSPCLCGAPNCRGTIHMRDQKDPRMKDVKRRIEVFWDGDQVYYRGLVVSFNPRTGKHRVKYDDGDEEELKLDTVPFRWLPNESPISVAISPSTPEIVGATKPGPGAQPSDTASSSHQEVPADGTDNGVATSNPVGHFAGSCVSSFSKASAGNKRPAPCGLPHNSSVRRASKAARGLIGKAAEVLQARQGALHATECAAQVLLQPTMQTEPTRPTRELRSRSSGVKVEVSVQPDVAAKGKHSYRSEPTGLESEATDVEGVFEHDNDDNSESLAAAAGIQSPGTSGRARDESSPQVAKLPASGLQMPSQGPGVDTRHSQVHVNLGPARHPPRWQSMESKTSGGLKAAQKAGHHALEPGIEWRAHKPAEPGLMNSEESNVGPTSRPDQDMQTWQFAVESVVGSARQYSAQADCTYVLPSSHMSLEPVVLSSQSKSSNCTRLLGANAGHPGPDNHKVLRDAGLTSEESNASLIAASGQEASGAMLTAASVATKASAGLKGVVRPHVAMSAESATMMAAQSAVLAENKVMPEAEPLTGDVGTWNTEPLQQPAASTQQLQHKSVAEFQCRHDTLCEKPVHLQPGNARQLDELMDQESQHSPSHGDVDEQQEELQSNAGDTCAATTQPVDGKPVSYVRAFDDAAGKVLEHTGKENIAMLADKHAGVAQPAAKHPAPVARSGASLVQDRLDEGQQHAERKDGPMEGDVLPQAALLEAYGQRSYSLQSSTSSACVASTTTSMPLQTAVAVSAGPNRSLLRPPTVAAATAAKQPPAKAAKSLSTCPATHDPSSAPALPTPVVQPLGPQSQEPQQHASHGLTSKAWQHLPGDQHVPDAKDADTMQKVMESCQQPSHKHAQSAMVHPPISRSRPASPAPSSDGSPALLSPLGRAGPDAAPAPTVGKRRRKPSAIAMEAALAQQEEKAKHQRKPVRPGSVTPPKEGGGANHSRKRSCSNGGGVMDRSKHHPGLVSMQAPMLGRWDASLQGALEALTAMQSPKPMSLGSRCESMSDTEPCMVRVAKKMYMHAPSAGVCHRGSPAGHHKPQRARPSITDLHGRPLHGRDDASLPATNTAARLLQQVRSKVKHEPAACFAKSKSLLSDYSILDKLGEVGLADCYKQHALLGHTGNELTALNLLMSTTQPHEPWHRSSLLEPLSSCQPQSPCKHQCDAIEPMPLLGDCTIDPLSFPSLPAQCKSGSPSPASMRHPDRTSPPVPPFSNLAHSSFLVDPPPPLQLQLPDEFDQAISATIHLTAGCKLMSNAPDVPWSGAAPASPPEQADIVAGGPGSKISAAPDSHPASATDGNQEVHVLPAAGTTSKEHPVEQASTGLLTAPAPELVASQSIVTSGPSGQVASTNSSTAAMDRGKLATLVPDLLLAPSVSVPPTSLLNASKPSTLAPATLPVAGLTHVHSLAHFLHQSAQLGGLHAAPTTLGSPPPSITASRTSSVQQLLPKVVSQSDPTAQPLSTCPPHVTTPLSAPLPLASSNVSSLPALLPPLSTTLPPRTGPTTGIPHASTSLAPGNPALHLLEQQLMSARGSFSPRLSSATASTFFQNSSILAEIMASSATQDSPGAMSLYTGNRPATDLAVHHASSHTISTPSHLPFFRTMPW